MATGKLGERWLHRSRRQCGHKDRLDETHSFVRPCVTPHRREAPGSGAKLRRNAANAAANRSTGLRPCALTPVFRSTVEMRVEPPAQRRHEAGGAGPRSEL